MKKIIMKIKKILSTKKLAVVGMIVGLLFVFVGILTVAGAFGEDTNRASSASYGYSSGYAKFGADYYTYVVNNAAEAASAARTAANNLDKIAGFLKTFCGVSSILIGLVIMCSFGIVWLSGDKETTALPFKMTCPPTCTATTEDTSKPSSSEPAQS